MLLRGEINLKAGQELKFVATLGLSGNCMKQDTDLRAARCRQGCTTTPALLLNIRERQELEAITPRQANCPLDSPQQDAVQKLLLCKIHCKAS